MRERGVRENGELLNAAVYRSPRVLQFYTDDRLTPPEASALLKFQSAFFGRDVLDIGVGTGRSTRYLAPLARRYVAIDNSPVMIEHMRRTQPRVDARELNMCDLSALEESSFDFIFAPNNVLDAVSHESRLSALAAWRRVLRHDGVMVFSSHNRRYRFAHRGPRLASSRNPLTQAWQLLRFARCQVNYRRLAHEQRETPEFALLTDSGHEFALLHYYVDRLTQCEQLRAHGFRCIEVFDHVGVQIEPDADAADSPSLTYVARRVD